MVFAVVHIAVTLRFAGLPIILKTASLSSETPFLLTLTLARPVTVPGVFHVMNLQVPATLF